MNQETRKLLRAMAKAEGVSVDEMLERTIQEAAGWRGMLAQQSPSPQYKREKFPFQYRDMQALRPDLRERVWKVRIASANLRAKRAGISGELTYEGWMAVLEGFGGKCARCGTQEYLCIDHVVPFAHDGLNVDSNTQPLCRDCNAAKGNTERRSTKAS